VTGLSSCRRNLGPGFRRGGKWGNIRAMSEFGLDTQIADPRLRERAAALGREAAERARSVAERTVTAAADAAKEQFDQATGARSESSVAGGAPRASDPSVG
jgi:hypothetical protein